MFVLAIHSDKQHLQAMLAPNGAVLRQVEKRWELAPPPSVGLKGNWIEILPRSSQHQVRCSKEIDLQSIRIEQKFEEDYFHSFTDGKTRFEISRFDLIGGVHSLVDEEDLTSPLRYEIVESLFRWNRDTEEDLRLATALMVESFGCESSGFARWDTNSRIWHVVAAGYRHTDSRIRFDIRPLDNLLINTNSHEYLAKQERMVMTPWFDKSDNLIGAIVGVIKSNQSEVKQTSQVASQLAHLARLVSKRQEQRDRETRRNNRKQLILQSYDSLQEKSEASFDLKSEEGFGTALVLQLPEHCHDSCRLEDLEKIMIFATDLIAEHQGKIIHFQSGKINAIWESRYQPEHLTLACRAAIAITNRANTGKTMNGSKMSVGVASGKLSQHSHLGTSSHCGRAIRMAQQIAKLAGEINISCLVADSPNQNQLKPFETRPLCRAKLLPNELATTLLQIGILGETLSETAVEKIDPKLYPIPVAVA